MAALLNRQYSVKSLNNFQGFFVCGRLNITGYEAGIFQLV